MLQIHNVLIVLFICVMGSIGSKDTLPPPEVSRTCKRIGFCDRVSYYPTALAKKLIQELKNENTIFANADEDDISEEVEDTLYRIFSTNMSYGVEKQNTKRYPKIHPRISNSDKEYSEEEDNKIKLCESTVQNKHPKVAENRDKTWHYILNDDDEPIQTYRSEICTPFRSSCSEKLILAPNYAGVCIQRWTFKEMYYIDENKTIATDYFKIPTCCSCKLYHTN